MSSDSYQRLITEEAPANVVLPNWIALAPFEEYLGMRIVEAVNGHAVLEMPFRLAHCQGGGLMHGGAVVSLADTALAIAIKTLLPEGTAFATVEMKLTFIGPVRWGTVTAEARVIEREDRNITGAVEVFAEGSVKARFEARFKIKRSV